MCFSLVYRLAGDGAAVAAADGIAKAAGAAADAVIPARDERVPVRAEAATHVPVAGTKATSTAGEAEAAAGDQLRECPVINDDVDHRRPKRRRPSEVATPAPAGTRRKIPPTPIGRRSKKAKREEATAPGAAAGAPPVAALSAAVPAVAPPVASRVAAIGEMMRDVTGAATVVACALVVAAAQHFAT